MYTNHTSLVYNELPIRRAFLSESGCIPTTSSIRLYGSASRLASGLAKECNYKSLNRQLKVRATVARDTNSNTCPQQSAVTITRLLNPTIKLRHVKSLVLLVSNESIKDAVWAYQSNCADRRGNIPWTKRIPGSLSDSLKDPWQSPGGRTVMNIHGCRPDVRLRISCSLRCR